MKYQDVVFLPVTTDVKKRHYISDGYRLKILIKKAFSLRNEAVSMRAKRIYARFMTVSLALQVMI